MKIWIRAFRLRTLPLALSTIGCGSFIAGFEGKFDSMTFFLTALTTLFLQVLSNLANDYGDTENGADSQDREGPSRAVQSGEISLSKMKKVIFFFVFLSFGTGLTLIIYSFGLSNLPYIIGFLVLGVASIWAAIKYTMGANPYGYSGFGDLFVFLFFGIVGVMGSYFLHTHQLNLMVLLPAITIGTFSVGVLNVNNIRDIDSDEAAGKYSIPVRVGAEKAKVYQVFMLLVGFMTSILYVYLNYTSPYQYAFIVVLPLIAIHLTRLKNASTPAETDPLLKQLAMTTLLYCLIFGLGGCASYIGFM